MLRILYLCLAASLLLRAGQPNPQAIEQANLGVSLAKKAQYGEAVKAYRNAIALEPGLPSIYLNLGLAYFKWGKFEPAARAFAEENKRSPSANAQTLLAMCRFGLGRYRAAATLLEPLAAAQPGNGELSYLLAKCYIWSGQSAQAMALFKTMLERDPNSAPIHMLMGEALDAQNRTGDAIEEFQRAAAANPAQPDVHFGLGYLYWKQKDFDAAQTQFQDELAHNPKSPQALAYLGDLAIKRGDKPQATSYLRRSLSAGAQTRLALLDLGILESENKQYSAAIQHFQRAIELDPTQADAHYRLARIYKETNRPAEAQRELATVTKLHEHTQGNLLHEISGGAPAPQPSPKP